MPRCYLFLGVATERFTGGFRELSGSDWIETEETGGQTGTAGGDERRGPGQAGQLPAGLWAQVSVVFALQETTPTSVRHFHRPFLFIFLTGTWGGRGQHSGRQG